MGRHKQKKFREFSEFPNTLEFTDSEALNKLSIFLSSKNNPIILELGCGDGRFINQLAKFNPQNIYIGIDIQGERLWRGAKEALSEKIDNVRFFRMRIDDLLNYFSKGQIDSIWITFPDPFPKDRDSKRRLTSERFLPLYKEILNEKGSIFLKTDSKDLFDYSRRMVKETGGKILEVIEDVHKSDSKPKELEILTKYEQKFMLEGEKINFLKASL